MSRGVCSKDGENHLTTCVERTEIVRQADGKVAYKDGDQWVNIPDTTPVSMNVWGFTPDYFEYSDQFFKDFLDAPETKANPKAEYLIPWVVNKLINDGTATCEVLDTTSKWFGVTYSADRPGVVAKIQKLVDEGVYPNKLF